MDGMPPVATYQWRDSGGVPESATKGVIGYATTRLFPTSDEYRNIHRMFNGCAASPEEVYDRLRQQGDHMPFNSIEAFATLLV
jgi:hypothetical protein